MQGKQQYDESFIKNERRHLHKRIYFGPLHPIQTFCIQIRPKGTNKTLAPMSLELFCQLLTSPKLPLIIFNITI